MLSGLSASSALWEGGSAGRLQGGDGVGRYSGQQTRNACDCILEEDGDNRKCDFGSWV